MSVRPFTLSPLILLLSVFIFLPSHSSECGVVFDNPSEYFSNGMCPKLLRFSDDTRGYKFYMFRDREINPSIYAFLGSRDLCPYHFFQDAWAEKLFEYERVFEAKYGIDLKTIPHVVYWEDPNSYAYAGRLDDKNCMMLINILEDKETESEDWCPCDRKTIYSGYLHFLYRGSYPFLKRQIQYTQKYPGYKTYWPETSSKARAISEYAVQQFTDLIKTTALKEVEENDQLYREFPTGSWYFRRLKRLLSRSLVVSCFRFSDFYQVCHDLNQFSRKHFSCEESIVIEDKMGSILDDLCPMFLDIYEESLSLHPTKEILEELEFIECCYLPSKQFDGGPLASRNLSESDYLQEISSSFEVDEIENYESDSEFFPRAAESNQPLWFVANLLLSRGTVYNDFFMYKNAVESLTEAIKIDPYMIEAYQERAHAYFEMGKLDLAIADYKKLKEIEKMNPPYSLKTLGIESREIVADVQYSTGFFVGICEGGACSIADLPGSTYQCCSGITKGLWSFYWADNKRGVAIEFSANVIATSYLLVEFIVSHTPQESAQLLVPELKELIKNWDRLSEYRKGENVGYIIGKYGVDVLIPIAAFNGLKRYRQLKRANSLLTIERCALSQTERAAIIDTSATYSARSAILCQSAKQGKVIARQPNVIPHIMQEKHAWDRLIKLTGDQATDCKQVMMLLEENNILSAKLTREMVVPFDDPSSSLRNLKFEKTINGNDVVAIFIKDKKTAETYLIDAWVVVK